jgi:hypothetical protein
MEYLAFSLKDFHEFQSGPQTNVRIHFIEAKNRESAEDFMNREFPDFPCTLITKKSFDKNIVRRK